MISRITIQAFKSIERVELDLGTLNVFVGANGSGKSNLLEGIGVLSAAADGRVTDQTLLQRGVRPGVPKLYKSAFASSSSKPHIYFSASAGDSHYDVTLYNPLKSPHPAWRFNTELWEHGRKKIVSRGPNLRDNPNTENGLAALKAVELPPKDPALAFLRELQQYLIYTPTTPVLRGVAPETQPQQPLGLSGGRLPDAVYELLTSRTGNSFEEHVSHEASDLITWASDYSTGPSDRLPLSPSASTVGKVLGFKDRFMKKGRNELSGYDASEGALYILFLAVLAAHRAGPDFFAIDNADHGLNPGLAKSLFKHFSQWLLDSKRTRQVLMTSHNPAVLDGLPLQNDRIRLFAVDRDNLGRTVVKRVELTAKMKEMASHGWTLSRMWMSGIIGGMPDV